MQTSGTQDMAKLTWLDPAVDLDLFHPLIENAHAATIPAYPDLVTDQLGGDFIEGASHFDITAAMGEQSLRRWLDRFGSTTTQHHRLVDMRHPHVSLHELKQFVEVHGRVVLCKNSLTKYLLRVFKRPGVVPAYPR
jgi:hypothetical protein